MSSNTVGFTFQIEHMDDGMFNIWVTDPSGLETYDGIWECRGATIMDALNQAMVGSGLIPESESPIQWMYELARKAYEAYCGSVGWKSAITGDDLPLFDNCPKAVKEAWIAATKAVAYEAEK